MYRIVTFGKCFADPTAVRMIRILMKSNATISDLQQILMLDRHTIDLRLMKLREAQIVKATQIGRWLSYTVDPEAKPVVDKLLFNFYDDVRWDPKCLADDERLRNHVYESA